MAIKIIIGKENAYLASVVALAKKVYAPEDVSPVDKYASLFQCSPESFVFAVDDLTQQLVGYIISLPLNEEYFESTVLPDYDESTLSEMVVVPYKKGINKVYLFSIVINPEHPQRLSILKALAQSYSQQLREMASKGIDVVEASALALSDSGVKICQGLKMTRVADNSKGVVFVNRDFYEVFAKGETKENLLRRIAINRKSHEDNSLT